MRIEPIHLGGEHVVLEPLSRAHLGPLAAVLDPNLLQWFPKPVTNDGEMAEFIEDALHAQDAGTALPFPTIDRARGKVVGSTRFGNIDRANRRLEIGWTWIAKPWQRSAINTEAKLLMMEHAFEKPFSDFRGRWCRLPRIALLLVARQLVVRAATRPLEPRCDFLVNRHRSGADHACRDAKHERAQWCRTDPGHAMTMSRACRKKTRIDHTYVHIRHSSLHARRKAAWRCSAAQSSALPRATRWDRASDLSEFR